MKMRSLSKYVCSRQAQSANYEMKKPSNRKQLKTKPVRSIGKKAILKITIKELEEDTDRYAINTKQDGEVEEMKTLSSKSNSFRKTVKDKKEELKDWLHKEWFTTT